MTRRFIDQSSAPRVRGETPPARYEVSLACGLLTICRGRLRWIASSCFSTNFRTVVRRLSTSHLVDRSCNCMLHLHLQHVGGFSLSHPFFHPSRRRTASFAAFAQIARMARISHPGSGGVAVGFKVIMFDLNPEVCSSAEVARLIVLLRV